MLNNRSVIVVVPAFREEALLGRVIATMPSFVDAILVIDDASDDRTAEVARASGDPRVHVITHPERRGVGAAIATGYAEALRQTAHPSDAVAVMAGDGQMSPDELERVVLPILLDRADYVKGERFSNAGVRQAMGLSRWTGGQVFSRLTSLAVGHPVTDSQCGFTAISRSALLKLTLHGRGGLWPSFGYPNDLLGQLAVHKQRVVEVPVSPIYGDEQSKLRLRHLPPIFFLIARAALRRTRSGCSP
jgi:glycosyltransferase involved in cell wall biosynthesis